VGCPDRDRAPWKDPVPQRDPPEQIGTAPEPLLRLQHGLGLAAHAPMVYDYEGEARSTKVIYQLEPKCQICEGRARSSSSSG